MRTVAVLLLSLCTAAFAQNADQGSTAHKRRAAKASGSPDAQFATKAAQGNMAEVNLGKLATEKSQNDDVKKFAQMMVDDHSKAGDDLKGVASKNNLTVPDDVNAQQKAENDALSSKDGSSGKSTGKSKKKSTSSSAAGGTGLLII